MNDASSNLSGSSTPKMRPVRPSVFQVSHDEPSVSGDHARAEANGALTGDDVAIDKFTFARL